MAAQHRMELYVHAPPQAVMQMLTAQPAVAGMAVQYVDQINWVIHLKGGMDLLSWGEKITVQLFDPRNGGTQLRLYSESALSTTLVDWGKNKKNLQQIEAWLRSAFPVSAAPPGGFPPW